MKGFPKTLTVTVTDEDIKDGMCESASECAIAQAIKRDYGYAAGFLEEAIVGNSDVDLYTADGDAAVYDLPAKAQLFVEMFDKDKTLVKPLTFTMQLSPGRF